MADIKEGGILDSLIKGVGEAVTDIQDLDNGSNSAMISFGSPASFRT